MQIFARGCDGLTSTVEVDETTSLDQFKALLGVSASDDVLLSVGGRPLTVGAASLADCGLTNLATVDVNGRLLGGKVHGSLARAGKVRAQTPKVDKQEKKKSKTGRCKRRMQYNRRFVNTATQGPGRKKGPNSNAPPSG